MDTFRILAINPGSTSTKIAVYDGETAVFSVNLQHSADELAEFKELKDQKPYRMQVVLDALQEHEIPLESIDAFAGRGGGQETMSSGTYYINDLAYAHARDCYKADHPALLGCQIARDLGDLYGKPSYMVNAPCVDEFIDEARFSGMKEIRRISHIHALNQKEIAIRYAKSVGRKYTDMNLIVCHIGGGVSVTAHRKGRMIDSNDCLGSSGPFAPTRSGSVPVSDLIKMCYSGKYSEREMQDKVMKKGGLVSYLGTGDVIEVRERIQEGDLYARAVLNAMFYQIEKEIGAMSVVLKGDVDAIILTGGVSNDAEMVEQIKESCSFIAPVEAIPGEFEMEAMVNGTLRVLRGEEEPKDYTGEPVYNVEWFPEI